MAEAPVATDVARAADLAPARSTWTNGFRDAVSTVIRGAGVAGGCVGGTPICAASAGGADGAGGVCTTPAWDGPVTGMTGSGNGTLTWRSGGGAGAQPQLQFHVHVPALMVDCSGDVPPAAHPAGLQFQFQIHVSGSVPVAEGVTDTPVPSGRVGPLAAAPSRVGTERLLQPLRS